MDYKSGNIDLHIHSTASDGSFTPLEILALAQKTGLKAIALTDHDSIEGSKIVLQKRVCGPVKVMTGVEISAEPPDIFDIPGSFHILGYGFRVDHPQLNLSLTKQQNARKNRNPRIIDLLNELGIEISLEEVIEQSPTAQIGRPHIAKVLVKKNIAKSINDAFDTYIGNGKPAYIDKPRIEAAKAIDLIRSAGGISVLAHPGLLELTDNHEFDLLFAKLKSMGLKGVEVYFPTHTAEETAFFANLAKKHALLITGGTDFHGAINPDIKMGTGRDDLSIPYVLYETLENEINRLHAAQNLF